MSVRNIVGAIAALVTTAGAGSAYFAARSNSTQASAEPSAHATVVVETKEAPAGQASSVKIESGGKTERVEVQRSKTGSVVQVDNGTKSKRVEVQRSKTDEKEAQPSNVQVERKAGALHVKVGDLVVDTKGGGAD